jgi:Cytochrome c554 and c-prime
MCVMLQRFSGERKGMGAGLVALLLLALSSFGFAYGRNAATKADATAMPPAYLNTEPGVAYVGSRACAPCHKKLYEQYIRTEEGTCLIPADAPSELEKVPSTITIFNKKMDRYFQVFRKGSSLYQSEYQLDAAGNEVFRDIHKLAYASGPGRVGVTYFIWRGNYLFQAPLSYYTAIKQWALSPGYEAGDIGFSRAIDPGCVECHAGLPQFVPHRQGLFKKPPFLADQLSVGCENCHGPGQLHVEKWARRANPHKGWKNVRVSDKIDTSIVNPARLPAWMSNEICMNCHQRADARVLQPGKSFHDIRPGVPLVKVLALLNVPRGATAIPHGYMTIENYTDMEFSKCNLGSGGQLRCTDCHDSHYQPTASETPRFFRKRCLKCHTEKSCTLPLSVRRRKNPPNNCYGCHMLPGSITGRIKHATFTHHRIVARPGEPYPQAAYRQATPGLHDLVLMDAIPGQGSESLDPVTLLVAYGEIMRSNPQYRQPYFTLLDKLAKTKPDNSVVLEALATKEAAMGTPEGNIQAMRHLSEAIKLGETSPEAFELLAGLLAHSDRAQEGVETLKQGIELNPYNHRLYKLLALQYVRLKRYDLALQTMKQELKVYPEDSVMRELLGRVTPP